MFEGLAQEKNFQVLLNGDGRQIVADTTSDKGGGDDGIRPHSLLEAALAACMTMYVRMYAVNHGMLELQVRSRVELDRSNPDETLFRCELDVRGELSSEQRRRLLAVAQSCPVRQTLSKPLRFSCGESTLQSSNVEMESTPRS